MKKVQERTSRIHGRPLIGLAALIVAMSVVVLTGQELKHVPPAAPSFAVLHSFQGADGANPQAGLVRDAAGNLYGTTFFGGAHGVGVVFKVSATGTETVLHSFTGADGGNPFAGLIRDVAGNLYGTTSSGGTDANGVVFKLSPGGSETVLYNFTGGADGAVPRAGLVRDTAGNLYGTTPFGGATSTCNPPDGPGVPRMQVANPGCGVVFKLSPTGTETVLHTFTGGADGASPVADLIRDAEGNLYGTAATGGGGTCNQFVPPGCGTVFKLGPSGTETVLHSFTGADGATPVAGLVRDAAGNLYGTTYTGGADYGVVFKVSATGTETVLHSFTLADGAVPRAGLLRDAAGNLYGTTEIGGATSTCAPPQGCGVVFELIRCDTAPTGYDFKVLHTFTGGADGASPLAGLVQDVGGNLYGTADAGGSGQSGVVFRLTP
jgi:uncharacterized repeat protein (TIGR03803 family)